MGAMLDLNGSSGSGSAEDFCTFKTLRVSQPVAGHNVSDNFFSTVSSLKFLLNRHSTLYKMRWCIGDFLFEEFCSRSKFVRTLRIRTEAGEPDIISHHCFLVLIALPAPVRVSCINHVQLAMPEARLPNH